MSVATSSSPSTADPEAVPVQPFAGATDDGVRPFRVDVPEAEIEELRRRIAATRWPDRETVADRSQGAQLEKVQKLMRCWGSEYDWRQARAPKLNALPPGEARRTPSIRCCRRCRVTAYPAGRRPLRLVGGDWGSVVSDTMAGGYDDTRRFPRRRDCLAFQVNMPATVPPEIGQALANDDPPPAGLSEAENVAYESMNDLYAKGRRATRTVRPVPRAASI